MAPEILRLPNEGCVGHYYDKDADIYSLGVILHEIFYKSHPFNMEA